MQLCTRDSLKVLRSHCNGSPERPEAECLWLMVDLLMGRTEGLREGARRSTFELRKPPDAGIGSMEMKRRCRKPTQHNIKSRLAPPFYRTVLSHISP